jgi:dTDP-4-dehydrorhamnose reductase
VNRDGAENLAAACSQAAIPLIHVSTDYVFDGRGTRPYREEDPVSPLNAYGRSKAEGEDRIRARHPEHVILRTSWLYATHGRNFLTTMLRLGRERDTLSVVNDRVGCPTWARDLARAILQIAEALPRTPSPWGTYHCSNQGQTTWYGFAEAIFELAPQALALRVQNVHPISTEDYPTPAARPPYSVLNCARIHRSFGISLPPWRESVRTALRIPRKR